MLRVSSSESPCTSSIDKPNIDIPLITSLVGDASLVSPDLKAVPACEPFIPALAIKPIATAVSSTEYPSVPAIGAAYLKVSPINETLVFALDDVAARTSAK